MPSEIDALHMPLDLRITYAYARFMTLINERASLPLLTPKQKELLDYITSFRDNHGYAPSQHEIAKHFGFKSLGTVQNYLVRLERQGALRKTWNARRSTEVVAGSTTPTPVTSLSQRLSADAADQASTRSVAVPLPLLGR